MPIHISPRNVLTLLITITGLFLLINLVMQLMVYYSDTQSLSALFLGASLFQFDAETNFPTWFSNLLLISSAILLGLIAMIHRRWQWWLLSGLFFLLALDEVISLHERLNEPLRQLFEADGFSYNIWVFPALLFVMIMVVIFWSFFWHLPGLTRFQVALAAILFLSGALGAELVGGKLFTDADGWSLAYGLTSTLEETLELLGVSLFIYALLKYLEASSPYVDLHFSDEPVHAGLKRDS